jgi:hypothetical protein
MKGNLFTKYRLLICILIALLLGGVNYMFFNHQKSVFNQQIEVIVFNQDVGPNTLITNEMLAYKTIYLSSFDPNFYFQNATEVIGLYIKPNVTVFANQLISKKSITENYQSSLKRNLEDEHITYTIKLNELTRYGDYYEVGQEINLYFKGVISSEDKAIIHGLLIENAKIISTLNKEGHESRESEKMFLVLSLSESEYNLVQVATFLGELTPVVQDQTSVYFDKDELIAFILSHAYRFIKDIPVIEVEVDG